MTLYIAKNYDKTWSLYMGNINQEIINTHFILRAIRKAQTFKPKCIKIIY